MTKKKKSKDGINDRFNFTQEKAHDTEFTFTNVEQKSFKNKLNERWQC